MTDWHLVLADLSVPEICQNFAAHCAGNMCQKSMLQVCIPKNVFAAKSCGKLVAYLQQTCNMYNCVSEALYFGKGNNLDHKLNCEDIHVQQN